MLKIKNLRTKFYENLEIKYDISFYFLFSRGGKGGKEMGFVPLLSFFVLLTTDL